MNKKKQPQKSFIEILHELSHNKLFKLTLLGIIAICFFSNYSKTFDIKLDQNGDNINYFSLGKALAEGHGYTSIIGFTPKPHSHFPPGYPLFIAAIMKVMPDSITAVKAINGLLLFLSLIIIFYLIKRTTKNYFVAFLTSIVCAVHPELLRWSTIMMSEMLYMFLTLLALYLTLELTERKLYRNLKWLDYLLIGTLTVLISYIFFVRTMGTSLIIAVIGWFGIIALINAYKWIKSKRTNNEDFLLKKRMFKYLLIVGLLLFSFGISKLSWDKRNRDLGVEVSTYAKNFGKKKFNEDMSTFKDWKVRIKYNIKTYVTRWIPNTMFITSYELKEPVSKGEYARGIFIGLLMLVGLFSGNKARWLFFFYTAITMLVLVLYPEQFGGSRYYIPMIPLFVFFIINGISQLTKYIVRLKNKKIDPIIWQTVFISVFAFSVMTPRYMLAEKNLVKVADLESWKEMTKDEEMVEYLLAIDWCRENLPKDARVLSRKPELYYMYANFQHSEMFPRYGTPDSIYNFFVKKKATHVILDRWFRHGYVTVGPAIEKYKDKFKMIHKIGYRDDEKKKSPTFVFEFNDKWGYQGPRVNGIKKGKGYQIFQDNKKYVGEFDRDLPNGYGEYYDVNGKLIVKGIWLNGRLVRQVQ